MSSLAAFVPKHLATSLARRRLLELPFPETFPAALLFSDISGFTALTERLQSRGREGAEEIAAVINRAFRPVLRALERWQGSVTSFGGDAVFVIFSGPSPTRRAMAAAEEIASQFAARGAVATSAGPARLAIKQAIHHGRVKALHLGAPGERWYVPCGPAVSALARLESYAETGSILLSRAARRAAASEAPARPGRRRKERTSPALTAYVPRHVLRVRRHFTGEFRRAAILFLETKGHGAAALQRFARALQEVLATFDGILVSPDLSAQGTKWLCAFGAPVTHEDDVERAARAVLELLARCPRSLRIRGGMDVGTVANIWLGGPSRRSYELLGDVTNTAARTLASAPWGEVLVTEAARAALRGVETAPRGHHAAKGKAVPLELHALVALRPFDGGVRVLVPMVGREVELEAITGALEAARAGRGCAIGVKSDAGLGKSRLKFEAAARARALGLAVHEGRAISFQGMPYWTIRSLLRSSLGLAEVTPAPTVLGRLAESCEALGLAAAERHHLADVLGLRYEDSPVARLAPRNVAAGNALAVRAFLAAGARAQPAMVVLEDMHWTDSASADVVRSLVKEAGHMSLLVLLLYRPGYELPVGAEEIVLHDLPAAAVEELLRSHLGGQAPTGVAKAVAERAGGNPFYVEEVVRHMLESGVLERGAGGIALVREIRSDDLPLGIETLIAARLDRLSSRVRRVAQHAAVVGRSFFMDLLSSLPAITHDAESAVDDLAARELVFLYSVSPRIEYIWKHALTRDAVYAGLLGAHRRRVHRAVADAIERLLLPEGDAYLALLAHHRERAGQPLLARRAFHGAARVALRRFALEEAGELFEGYLRLQPRPTEHSILVRNELGNQVLRLTGHLKEAEALHREALALARACHNEQLVGASARQLAVILQTLGRMDEARPLYEESLAIAAKRGVPQEYAATLSNIGVFHVSEGRPNEARAMFERALAIRRDLGDRPSQVPLLGNLATLAFETGRPQEALRRYEETLALARELGERRLEGRMLGGIGNVRHEMGAPREALELHRQALAIARDIGDRDDESLCLGNCANALKTMGRLDDAERDYREALAIAWEVGGKRSQADWSRNLGSLLVERRRLAEAEEMLETALAIAVETGDTRAEGFTRGMRALLHFHQGRIPEAREGYARALARNREFGDRRCEGVNLHELAVVELFAGGGPERAAELVRASVEILSAMDEVEELVRALLAEARVALDRGTIPGGVVDRIRRHVCDLGVGPGAPLERQLALLERAIEAARSGAELLHGFLPDELTEGVRRWVGRDGGRGTGASALIP